MVVDRRTGVWPRAAHTPSQLVSMHTRRTPEPDLPRNRSSLAPHIALARSLALLFATPAALLAANSLFAGALLAAQTPPAPAQPTAPAAQKAAAQQKPSPTGAPLPQSAPQPQPPPPDWPANNSPTPASIIWDSRGLEIVASNSSLTQILKEVSLATGAKVEGLDSDERVFGTYGPGPARDVLYNLLDGSDYNVILVGDLGKGTPRRVVLTRRSGSTPQTPGAAPGAPNQQDDSEADEQAEQPEQFQPQPNPPPQPNGAPPGRMPPQFMQELQERQRQIQQQQQQSPQN